MAVRRVHMMRLLQHINIQSYARNSQIHSGMMMAAAANSNIKEVGKLQPIKTDESYKPGQTFMHKLFPYRGVILATGTLSDGSRALETMTKTAKKKDKAGGEKTFAFRHYYWVCYVSLLNPKSP